jgi:hypothetical protein
MPESVPLLAGPAVIQQDGLATIRECRVAERFVTRHAQRVIG